MTAPRSVPRSLPPLKSLGVERRPPSMWRNFFRRYAIGAGVFALGLGMMAAEWNSVGASNDVSNYCFCVAALVFAFATCAFVLSWRWNRRKDSEMTRPTQSALVKDSASPTAGERDGAFCGSASARKESCF